MQLDRHFVFAGGLDRMLEHDAMTIDLVAELVLQALHQVLGGDRTESFAGFAGLEREDDLQFADAARELFGFVQFRASRSARFAFKLSSWRRLRFVTS